VSVVPRLQYAFLNLRGRRLVNDTVTAGLLSLMFDQLTLKAAYRPRLSFSYDSPSTLTQHFGQDNTGTVVLNVTPAPVHFESWLKILAPVFTAHGVVLAATLDPTYQRPAAIPPPGVGSVTEQDLESARQRVDAKAPALDSFFAKDTAVTIGKAAFANLSDKLGAALVS
jgi:hypothetical protein